MSKDAHAQPGIDSASWNQDGRALQVSFFCSEKRDGSFWTEELNMGKNTGFVWEEMRHIKNHAWGNLTASMEKFLTLYLWAGVFPLEPQTVHDSVQDYEDIQSMEKNLKS